MSQQLQKDINNHPIVKTVATSMAIVAVTSAFFVSPLLPYMSLSSTSLAGIALALGAGMYWQELLTGTGQKWGGGLPWLFLMAVSLIALIVQLTLGVSNYHNNANRCADIEQRMLKANPDRDDLPELFQAFDCQPSSNRYVKVFKTSKKTGSVQLSVTSPVK